jgi:alginate O-acetyltransferase complex protein AlgJ
MAQKAAPGPRILRADRTTHRDSFPPAPGIFMALFLAAGLLLSLANPALFVSPKEPLLDGSWAAAYQERFDSESLLFDPATSVWGVIEYVLFDQGRPGVLVGSDGWLYSTEEFAFPDQPERAAVLEANVARVAEVAERLELRGAGLVVALVPAKARVYPEHLGRYDLPAGPLGRYDRALSALQGSGINVANPLPALLEAKESQIVFLRTDTHWTPFGARVAAAEVAGAISSLDEYAWLDNEGYTTTSSEPQPYRGDLTRFLPLGPFQEWLGPAADMLAQVETSSSSSPGSDLFAEVQLPVVLVGTSYSEDERWNFAGWLRQSLGSDVLVAAQQGQGPYEPMIEYLEGDAFESATPQVVVWEIPERYLSERWQIVEEVEP